MNPAWEWTESDIDALLKEQRPEDLALDYKRSEALDRGKKEEISKDVSAMANSAGGVLIYGLDENKPSGPIKFDGGIDPLKVTTEWIEQVIDSNIQRRIEGVRVRPIPMPLKNTTNVIYLVYVPQSNLAPHMAADRRFHKRLGTTTGKMEEYEVRDVGRRSQSPDLVMTVEARWSAAEPTSVVLVPWIQNRSPEPAFYATFRIYLAAALALRMPKPGSGWSAGPQAQLVFGNNPQAEPFHAFHFFWGIPERKPLLEGESLRVSDIELNVATQNDRPKDMVYHLGYEIRSPKMSTRITGMILQFTSSGAEVLKNRHQLTSSV